MTALTAAKNITQKAGSLQAFPVAASVTIYAGAMVAIDASGYANPAADTAGLKVVGFARDTADNSSGSAGAIYVVVDRDSLLEVVASSITQAMVGQMMYVVDDQTVDDTSTNLIAAGVLVEYKSTTSGVIDFSAINRVPVGVTQDRLADDVVHHSFVCVSGVLDDLTIDLGPVPDDCTVIECSYWTSQALGTGLGIDVIDGGAAGAGTTVIDACSDNLNGADNNTLTTPYSLDSGDHLKVKVDNVTASTVIAVKVTLETILNGVS